MNVVKMKKNVCHWKSRNTPKEYFCPNCGLLSIQRWWTIGNAFKSFTHTHACGRSIRLELWHCTMYTYMNGIRACEVISMYIIACCWYVIKCSTSRRRWPWAVACLHAQRFWLLIKNDDVFWCWLFVYVCSGTEHGSSYKFDGRLSETLSCDLNSDHHGYIRNLTERHLCSQNEYFLRFNSNKSDLDAIRRFFEIK